jgi:hypothetical protein
VIESISGRTNGWGGAYGGAPDHHFGLKQAIKKTKIKYDMALDGHCSMIVNETTNQKYMGAMTGRGCKGSRIKSFWGRSSWEGIK